MPVPDEQMVASVNDNPDSSSLAAADALPDAGVSDVGELQAARQKHVYEVPEFFTVCEVAPLDQTRDQRIVDTRWATCGSPLGS